MCHDDCQRARFHPPFNSPYVIMWNGVSRATISHILCQSTICFFLSRPLFSWGPLQSASNLFISFRMHNDHMADKQAYGCPHFRYRNEQTAQTEPSVCVQSRCRQAAKGHYKLMKNM